MIARLPLTMIVLAVSAVSLSRADEPIRHSFFVAGPVFTGIVDEEGNKAWDAGRPRARDAFVLVNGNVLVTWANEVKELTRDGDVVFHYLLSPENKELGTAARLANGNTLITELGPHPKLLEVTAENDVAVSVPLQPETDNAHMQTRMARKLPDGNYLVPHLLAFQIKEYTPQGKVVKSFATDLDSLGGREAENWPFTAIRLENGNTLSSLTHGNKVVEFDPEGNVVWQVSAADFDRRLFDDACGCQRLPNGNTVITAYHATKGVKLFEVTRDKQLVWTYEGPFRAHHFQILTTNGEPIAGPPLK